MTGQVNRWFLGRSISLPDWIQLSIPETDEPVDLTVRLGTLPPGLGTSVFDLDDAVRIHVSPGLATVEALADLGDRALEHYLVDHAVPNALTASGDVVLHGACMALPTAQGDPLAVILLGPSGAGKSTLSLALLEAGWTLLGDDTVRVEISNGSAIAWPTYSSIRLHEDIFTNRPDLTPGPLVAEYANKRRLPVADFANGPCRIFGVVSLGDAQGETTELHSQGPVQLCAAMAENLFAAPGESSDAIARFDSVLPIASVVGGHTLVYPRTSSGSSCATTLLTQTIGALRRRG